MIKAVKADPQRPAQGRAGDLGACTIVFTGASGYAVHTTGRGRPSARKLRGGPQTDPDYFRIPLAENRALAASLFPTEADTSTLLALRPASITWASMRRWSPICTG